MAISTAVAGTALLPHAQALVSARPRLSGSALKAAGSGGGAGRLGAGGVRQPGSADSPAGFASSPPAPSEAFVRGQDFIRRCIAGDPATRDEFVSQYGALVRYAVAKALRARNASLLADELEDLTQSVLLSFFDRDCRRLKMYEGRNQASFATFIRVCATRQTLDYLRSRRRKPPLGGTEPEREDDAAGLAGAVDPAAGPEERAATSEGIARLARAVAELSPREQMLVRLHFVLGCDVAEVATALGVSPNAVHVMKSRIKAKLRSLVDLGDDGDA